MKNIILNTVNDLVLDFLYYDRKEDEDLPERSIQKAIEVGDISVKDIVDHFESQLKIGLGRIFK